MSILIFSGFCILAVIFLLYVLVNLTLEAKGTGGYGDLHRAGRGNHRAQLTSVVLWLLHRNI